MIGTDTLARSGGFAIVSSVYRAALCAKHYHRSIRLGFAVASALLAPQGRQVPSWTSSPTLCSLLQPLPSPSSPGETAGDVAVTPPLRRLQPGLLRLMEWTLMGLFLRRSRPTLWMSRHWLKLVFYRRAGRAGCCPTSHPNSSAAFLFTTNTESSFAWFSRAHRHSLFGGQFPGHLVRAFPRGGNSSGITIHQFGTDHSSLGDIQLVPCKGVNTTSSNQSRSSKRLRESNGGGGPSTPFPSGVPDPVNRRGKGNRSAATRIYLLGRIPKVLVHVLLPIYVKPPPPPPELTCLSFTYAFNRTAPVPRE